MNYGDGPLRHGCCLRSLSVETDLEQLYKCDTAMRNDANPKKPKRTHTVSECTLCGNCDA